MKKSTIGALLLSLLVTPVCYGTINKWQNTDLNIVAIAPPALVYITDSNGNRTGANPAIPLNANGQQISSPFGLKEIPNSLSQQTNNSVGDINTSNFGPTNHTLWEMDIYDGGKNTYTINATGVVAGDEHVVVTAIVKTGVSSIKPQNLDIHILVSPNQTNQVQLNFDPNQTTLMAVPIVANGGLLNDIKSACALGLIQKWACDFLEDKAERIQKALDNKRYGEARELVQSFLYNLGELGGHGDDDRDCHTAIQPSALTIFKADAKALLEQLNTDRHHH